MIMMQERLRAMEANVTNQPSAGLQGTPTLEETPRPEKPHPIKKRMTCAVARRRVIYALLGLLLRVIAGGQRGLPLIPMVVV